MLVTPWTVVLIWALFVKFHRNSTIGGSVVVAVVVDVVSFSVVVGSAVLVVVGVVVVGMSVVVVTVFVVDGGFVAGTAYEINK